MDDNNQILDVTYGKFSCRLEGFEDSVETMKLVVSFFHDMAGHDRFMDTAPLAPDMDTLARLTEEQTGQSVDIETIENKISLRVRPEDTDESTEIEDDASVEESAPVAVEEPAQTDEYDEEERANELSGVADKLKRMRAAAERKRVAPSDDFAEDLSEPVVTPVVNPLSQRLSELAKRTVEAEQSASANDAHADLDDVVEVQPPVAHDEEDTFDADDINVFSNLTEQSADVEEQMASEHEDISEEAPVEDDADAEDVMSADFTEAEDEMLEADNDDVDDDAAETVLAETAPTDMDDDFAAPETSEDLVSEEEAFSVDEELDAFLAAEDEAISSAANEEVSAEEEPVAELEDEAAEAEDETVADAAEAPEEPASEEPPLVLTSGDAAEDDHDDYNDDDEFDLEKEVAKVEAEIAARKGNEFARRGLPRHVEDAMSRIMSQTDQHLNQPENRRHRDAFAQLKAAVAATEAARQLGDKGADKRDPDEVYKDDLGAHDAKDKDDVKSAPPLKLVKSQEVAPEVSDHDDNAPAPVAASEEPADAPSARLRQIATQKESEVVAESGDFASFAASHGATDLADQLEAAGAYICLVEGEDDFSRPQVMKVVQSASDAEISREDGLRSFGRLLRQARLVKLANGRFQVAENTQFRPDGHQAAQG